MVVSSSRNSSGSTECGCGETVNKHYLLLGSLDVLRLQPALKHLVFLGTKDCFALGKGAAARRGGLDNGHVGRGVGGSFNMFVSGDGMGRGEAVGCCKESVGAVAVLEVMRLTTVSQSGACRKMKGRAKKGENGDRGGRGVDP